MPSQKRQLKRWTRQVAETSSGVDLEPKVFAKDDARSVAGTIKRSAEACAQERSVFPCNVHADVLGQSCRQELAQETPRPIGGGQGCVARPVWKADASGSIKSDTRPQEHESDQIVLDQSTLFAAVHHCGRRQPYSMR
jgi:hypothetical protein